MTLELQGVDVRVVDDPEAARQLLEGERFDALIVDEWLDKRVDRPESGSRLVEELVAGGLGEANRSTPFVFVTGDAPWPETAGAKDWPGYVGVIDKAGDMSRQVADIVNRLVVVPGLVDPAGQPLTPAAPGYEDLAIRFGAVSEQALAALAADPALMQELHWRDFEELVAELFDRSGFDVTLTAKSDDKGVDLFAARHTGIGSLLYVVECKRYKGMKVGPKLVRELRGVVDREQANCGILATTSYFTDKARSEQGTTPFRIALQDLDDVAGWVRGRGVPY